MPPVTPGSQGGEGSGGEGEEGGDAWGGVVNFFAPTNKWKLPMGMGDVVGPGRGAGPGGARVGRGGGRGARAEPVTGPSKVAKRLFNNPELQALVCCLQGKPQGISLQPPF